MRGTSSSRGINTRNLFTAKTCWTKINENACSKREKRRASRLVSTLNPRFSFVKMRGTIFLLYFENSFGCSLYRLEKKCSLWSWFFASFCSFARSSLAPTSRTHFFPFNLRSKERKCDNSMKFYHANEIFNRNAHFWCGARSFARRVHIFQRIFSRSFNEYFSEVCLSLCECPTNWDWNHAQMYMLRVLVQVCVCVVYIGAGYVNICMKWAVFFTKPWNVLINTAYNTSNEN